MREILLIVLFLFSTAISAQEKWSLDKCIGYAKEHNIDILKKQYQNKIVDEDVVIAKGNYYPDANFFASQGFNLGNSFNVSTGVGQRESRFNSFSLSSSTVLFKGFANRLKLQQVKLIVDKGIVDLDQLGLDLSLNITNKYLQILFNKEILNVAKEQVKISDSEVIRLKKLFEAALKPKSELLEMEATFSLDKRESIIAENNLNNSYIELKRLLDIKDIEDFVIQEIDIAQQSNIDEFSNSVIIYEQALKINPLLRSTRLNLDVNKKDIEIAKTNYYPTINFNYSYSSNYYHIQGSDDTVFNPTTNQFEGNGFFTQLNNNKTHYVGLTANIPIFNRFLTRSNIDKAKLAMEIAEVELEDQKKELKNKIEIAFNDVLSAKSTLEASQDALLSQKEAFSIAGKKYKQALMTNYDFLDSKSKYTQAQSETIKAKYDYLFKIKILEYYKN